MEEEVGLQMTKTTGVPIMDTIFIANPALVINNIIKTLAKSFQCCQSVPDHTKAIAPVQAQHSHTTGAHGCQQHLVQPDFVYQHLLAGHHKLRVTRLQGHL